MFLLVFFFYFFFGFFHTLTSARSRRLVLRKRGPEINFGVCKSMFIFCFVAPLSCAVRIRNSPCPSLSGACMCMTSSSRRRFRSLIV
uniref:Putative secreted protein n=1 Tax=Ixodes scapularis TaxID=6945 RepID=A0A4D5S0S4_IXOSC